MSRWFENPKLLRDIRPVTWSMSATFPWHVSRGSRRNGIWALQSAASGCLLETAQRDVKWEQTADDFRQQTRMISLNCRKAAVFSALRTRSWPELDFWQSVIFHHYALKYLLKFIPDQNAIDVWVWRRDRITEKLKASITTGNEIRRKYNVCTRNRWAYKSELD